MNSQSRPERVIRLDSRRCSCAEFFSARLGTAARQNVEPEAADLLAARHPVDVPLYETLERGRDARAAQPDVAVEPGPLSSFYDERYAGRNLLILDGVADYRRTYRNS